MKKLILFLCGTLVACYLMSQQPVSWEFNARKTSDKTYEIHLIATIKEGWHMYAMQQPESFIGKATTVNFTKHPLVVFTGAIEEIGHLKKSKETQSGIESWEYRNKLELIQELKLKSDTKTVLLGDIEFQSCTNEICLPPATVSFKIVLN